MRLEDFQEGKNYRVVRTDCFNAKHNLTIGAVVTLREKQTWEWWHDGRYAANATPGISVSFEEVEKQFDSKSKKERYHGYYVYRYGDFGPRVIHKFTHSAEAEAERLAKKHLGSEFQVLAIVKACKAEEPVVQWIKPKADQEFIPHD